MKKYDKFIKLDSDFKPINDVKVLPMIPPGVYEVKLTPLSEVYFANIDTRHDSLVDLPNTEYDTLIREIETFMKPETRVLFEEYGFLYKRSSLLYGPPGAGKTCIVNRIVQKVISDGGVVLFSPEPRLLEESFKILDAIQPETRVMVILEELDELINHYETELLNLLDGEIQKNNVIFMATTNYIDKIPSRIRRPGRFSSVVEVGFPSKATRLFYLKTKLKKFSEEEIQTWANKTDNFSIDELKETVLAVACLGYTLDEIVKRIVANKQDSDYNTYIEEHYDDDDKDEDDNFDYTLRNRKKRSNG